MVPSSQYAIYSTQFVKILLGKHIICEKIIYIDFLPEKWIFILFGKKVQADGNLTA